MNYHVIMFERSKKAGFSIGRVFAPIAGKLAQIELLRVPSHRSLPGSIIRNCWYIYRNRIKNGINHINGDLHYGVIALIGCKSVVTIHDLCVVDLNHGIKRWLKGLIWFKIPMRITGKVVCISEYTKRRVCNYTNYPENKVSVIYNPIDNAFCYSPKDFNSEKPIILHIGTRPNKNLERVIEAVAGIKCCLRIIGDVNNDIKQLLKDRNVDYSIGESLSDEEIVREYVNCDIVSFPSLYEGFGMPIIEGQATGRCVVTSNLDPMPEIAGGGAVLVNPYSIESIREGFTSIIKEHSLREYLLVKGRKNAERFNVEKIASQYASLYESYMS